MKMSGKNIFTSFLVGRAMAGGDGVDKSAENSARNDAKIAQNEAAVSQDTSLALAIAVRQARNEAQNWRQYAARLRTHLEARKVCEAKLLEELRVANINHPLATEAGFSEILEHALATQYASPDDVFDALEAERMRRSVEEGRMAVS
jgi:hypothetical protein